MAVRKKRKSVQREGHKLSSRINRFVEAEHPREGHTGRFRFKADKKNRTGDGNLTDPTAKVLPGKPVSERLAADVHSARMVSRIQDVGRKIGDRLIQLDKSKDELFDADKEINKIVRETGDKLTDDQIASVKSRYNKAREAVSIHEAKIRELTSSQRDEVRAILKSDRPQKWSYHGSGLDHEVVGPRVKEAESFLAPLVSARSDDNLAVVVNRSPAKTLRASFDQKKRNITVGDSTDVSTIIHERGHHLEEVFPDVGKASSEFLKYRTAGETPTAISSIDKGYGPGEFGKRDKFDAHFNGAKAYYVGKSYKDATEIMSMGLEALHRDPVRFATDDPEYARFVIGVLSGRI